MAQQKNQANQNKDNNKKKKAIIIIIIAVVAALIAGGTAFAYYMGYFGSPEQPSDNTNADSPVSVVEPAVAPPAQVTDLCFENLCTSAKFTWTAVDGATGYEIYAQGEKDSDFKLVATCQNPEYTKSGLQNGYTAQYKVRAFVSNTTQKAYGEFSEVVDVLCEHIPASAWTIIKDETCIDDGKRRNECMYCKSYFYEIIPADYTIHKYKTTVVEATCTTEGYAKHVCSVCSKELITDKVDATGHTAVEIYSQKANCLDTGYVKYQCSQCKLVWKETEKAKGHSLICKTYQPMCESEGYSHYTCTTCLEEYNSDFVQPLGHTYTAQKTVTSCTDSVVVTYTCNNCPASYIENLDSVGHDYQFVKTVARGCFTEGYDLYACKVCGSEYRTNITDAYSEHILGDTPVNIESSCGIVAVYQCEHCNYQELAIPFEDFSTIHTNTVDKVTDGFDINDIQLNCGDYCEYMICCLDCGQVFYLDCLTMPHSWEFRSKVAPTCTADGYDLYKCSACQREYRTNIVPKQNHDYQVQSVVAAQCTTAGYTTYKCSRCPVLYTGDFTNPTGHNYDTITYAPTCTARGYDLQVCSVCASIGGTSNYVSKIGHDYEIEPKTYPATCTEDGFYGVKCINCSQPNSETMTNVVAKLGHDLASNYTVDAFTGYRHYTCSRCSEGKTDTTCYIDIANKTVSLPSVAQFEDVPAQMNGSVVVTPAYTKLTLNPDGVSDYELVGTATNMAIKVNVTFTCDVKLAGVNITNNGIYGIDFDDETVDESLASTADNIIEDNIPKVSLSVKEGTQNNITVNNSGNAIENACQLDIKGKGTLVLKSQSTTIDSKGKLEIKNLTLQITSGNRGIDTKHEIYNQNNQLVDTEFYNVTIKGNANVTINSADDGIRCKKFEMSTLDADEVDSKLVIVAGGDGIQAEGKKKGAIIFNSGVANIKADNTPLKSEANSIIIYDTSKIKY